MIGGRVFDEIYNGVDKGKRFIDNCGGTRSSKTFSTLQMLIYMAVYLDETPTTTSVVSESIPHLKRGAIKDFREIMEGDGKYDPNRWNATDKTYTFPNGSKIEFFSADTQGKVMGASRKRLFINEAQNIPYDIARQLFVRTTDRIFIDYNPTHEFWVHKYIKGSGKEYTINSTYTDNPFLSKAQVEEIESNKNDTEWWNVYGLGLTGRKQGLVFQQWEQVDKIPHEAKFKGRGVDFGFTNDPTAIVDVYLYEGCLYLDERLYETRLTNDSIAYELKRMDIKSRYYPTPIPIVADSAEMKSIQEIRNFGIKGIEPATKGQGSINIGIDAMKRYKIRVTRDSVNLIRELRNYMWKTDKLTGETLNIPIDRYNHAIDAVRYVVGNLMTERPKSKGTYFRNLEII